MKKVIKSNGISVDSLVHLINSTNKVIVFYRTNNKPDGIPTFLTKSDKATNIGYRYYFTSSIFNYGSCFESLTLEHCLTLASKERQLFVLDANNPDEIKELFKDTKI